MPNDLMSWSISDITRTWSQRFQVRGSALVNMGECYVRISSNCEDLLEEIGHYYRGFTVLDEDVLSSSVDTQDIFAWESDVESTPVGESRFQEQAREGGKSGVKESYVRLSDGLLIRKTRTGMLYAIAEDLGHVIGPCRENLPQVVNFANNRAIQYALRQGDLLGHAAALVAGDTDHETGIAFAGFSGMGKSTLALHLMSAAPFRFLSNDRIMFGARHSKIRMTGVAKHPRINPGTILNNSDLHALVSRSQLDAWSKMPRDKLWTLEEKYDGFVDQCFGVDRFSLAGPLNDFVVLNWKHDGGPTRLHGVDLSVRRDLLGAIRKSPGLFYLSQPGKGQYDGTDERYLETLRQVRIFELAGGIDFHAAVDLILERMF